MLYTIDDNFLRFWFRFVYRHQSIIELKAYERLRQFVLRDYKAFSGIALEGYFRRRLAEEGTWTRIGGWWDRKGEQEIDVVAVDDFDKRVLFAEVKRNADKINPAVLKAKSEEFLKVNSSYIDYDREYRSLSMSDL